MSGDTTREIKVPIDDALTRAGVDLLAVARWLRDRSASVPAGRVNEDILRHVDRLEHSARALYALAKETRHWPQEERDR